MKAVVVYESLWGNTAAIARAIAEGIGEGTPALSTAEATPDALEGVDLIVAGAPVLGFSLPTDTIRSSIEKGEPKAPARPDMSHPSMRSWLDSLPKGTGRSASFETRIWWSPGGCTKGINKRAGHAGYEPIGKGERFIVTDRYGPLRDGEIERARAWGMELAKTAG